MMRSTPLPTTGDQYVTFVLSGAVPRSGVVWNVPAGTVTGCSGSTRKFTVTVEFDQIGGGTSIIVEVFTHPEAAHEAPGVRGHWIDCGGSNAVVPFSVIVGNGGMVIVALMYW